MMIDNIIKQKWRALLATGGVIAALAIAYNTPLSTIVRAKPVSIEVPAVDAPFEEKLEAAQRQMQAQGLNVIVGFSHYGGAPEYFETGKLAEDGLPADKTQVDLNSITKLVTGTMISKLVDQGKLKASEKLGDIFENVPADKAEITVHQLLTHAAGFPGGIGDDYERLNKEGFLKRAFKYRLPYAPGTRYEYSNTGYSILAAIIEKRTGKTYEEYLMQDVINELDMKDTGYMAVYDESRALKTVKGKTIKKTSWGDHEPYWNLIGNGGLITTPHDIMTFLYALGNGHVISETSLETLATPHMPEEEGSDVSFYGYGLVVQDDPELGMMYWHDGGNGYISTYFANLNDRGDTVFIVGIDTDEHEATEAMAVLMKYLYGIQLEG